MSSDTPEDKSGPLVERLRGNYVTGLNGARDFSPYVLPISLEAATEIESLTERVKALEQLIKDAPEEILLACVEGEPFDPDHNDAVIISTQELKAVCDVELIQTMSELSTHKGGEG